MITLLIMIRRVQLAAASSKYETVISSYVSLKMKVALHKVMCMVHGTNYITRVYLLFACTRCLLILR